MRTRVGATKGTMLYLIEESADMSVAFPSVLFYLEERADIAVRT